MPEGLNWFSLAVDARTTWMMLRIAPQFFSSLLVATLYSTWAVNDILLPRSTRGVEKIWSSGTGWIKNALTIPMTGSRRNVLPVTASPDARFLHIAQYP